MEKINRILWGIVFIVLGVIVALNTLDIIDFNIFFSGWWTLLIIIPCFIGLFDETNKSKIENIVGIIIGLILLLVCQNIINITILFKLFIPAVLVFIGLYMILGNVLNNKYEKVKEKVNKKDSEVICATFAEQYVNKENEKFTNGKVDAIFGGVVLDLTNATLKEETYINASAIFGSVDIIVPKNVIVKVKSTPIFGGVTNKSKTKDGKKTIYIDALALFGGIEIK